MENLILSRRPNEAVDIKLNGEIVATVTLLQIRGNQVRLSFKADDDVTILRTEIADKNDG